MSSPEQKSSGPKESLLESAKQLFSARGYHAVSTRELAEHAGVNLGAIPYYYGSKSNLFIETVRSLLKERHERVRLFASDKSPGTRLEAACALCHFIRAMLKDLCDEQGPDACRIMQREMASEGSEDPEVFEALLSSIVEEFIQPIDNQLLSLVRILSPHSSEHEHFFMVQSIIGQCAFYMTHKAFVRKLRGKEFQNTSTMSAIANFIITHNLRALRFTDEEMEEVFLEAGHS